MGDVDRAYKTVSSSSSSSTWSNLGIGDNKFTAILPVLFYEYLALSLTKSIVPGMIISQFGDYR